MTGTLNAMNDLELSARLGLRFYVSTKERQFARWNRFTERVALDEALQIAGATTGYEVGVFLASRTGGTVYWTSLHAGIFNSTAVHRTERE